MLALLKNQLFRGSPGRRAGTLPLLLVLVFVTGGIWIFAELADEVGENTTQALDERILLALRNPADPSDPLGPRWLEEMGRDITALGGVAIVTLSSVGTALYLLLRNKGKTALLLVVTIGGGLLLSMALKQMFARPRPSLVPHASYVYTSSFPSAHSLMSAVTYLTLGVLVARVHRGRVVKLYILCAALLLSTLIGISRVYLGVHYPTDVLAGWTLGASWALLCLLVAYFLERRALIEPEASSTPPGKTTVDE